MGIVMLRLRISFDKNGNLWQGVHWWWGYPWFDCGLFSIDIYPKGRTVVAFYFWKLVFELHR